jgi:hypothetical protein
VTLGQSRLSNNLSRLAKAVNTGPQPDTPETEADPLLLRADVARYQDSALPEREPQRRAPYPERENRKRQRGHDRTRDRGFE